MNSPPPFDVLAPFSRGTTLIEASAGTGKTYAITSLFLRLILEQELTVDQVLVVTFTEAATMELRDRLRERLRRALVALSGGPDDGDALIRSLLDRARRLRTTSQDIEALRCALQGFDEATISTIHGFCHRVLRDNAFETGAPFEAELMTNEADLREEVARDFWVRELHDSPPDFFRFLTRGRSRGALTTDLSTLRQLAARVCSAEAPALLPGRLPPLPPAPDPERWEQAVHQLRELGRQEGPGLRSLLEQSGIKKNSLPALLRQLQVLEGWLVEEGSPRSEVTEALSALTPDALAAKARQGQPVPSHPFFDACAQLRSLAEERMAFFESRALELRWRFVSTAGKELAARKRLRGLCSFDDLLRLVAEALRGTAARELAAALSQRYRAVLIDEFQDTDSVQYEIFSRLFADQPGLLFLIGDPKQAIYSFRGANLYAYLRAARAAGERRCTLDTNWRSDGQLLAAVECLFRRVTDPFQEAGIDFVSVRAAQPQRQITFAVEPQAPFRVRFVRDADFPHGLHRGLKTVPRLNARWGERFLAAVVAADIVSLLEDGTCLAGRPLQAGDLAVLVRSNHQGRLVQAELRARSVPCVAQGEESVWSSSEAGELLLVLTAVAEPSHHRRLKAALATDLLGWTVSRLNQLVHHEQEWEEQVEGFRLLQRRWFNEGFIRMFRAFMRTHRVAERLLQRPEGERRLTNLLQLAELLQRAAHERHWGPAGLLRWLERQRISPETNGDEAQLRMECDTPAVQVVTMHKAKGLQYPVVFCPYLWWGTQRGAPPEPFPLWHDPDHDHRATLDLGSPDIESHRRRAQLEQQTEALRLFYVAVTRAQQACWLYTGPFASLETSALGALLHARPSTDGAPRLEQIARDIERASGEELLAQLQALAESSAGAIAVDTVQAPSTRSLREVETAPCLLAARAHRRVLDSSWRIASFSQMTFSPGSSASPHQDADHDQLVSTADHASPAEPPRQGELVTLHDFARGPEAGTFLHHVLEQIDFQYATLEPLNRTVVKSMRAFGIAPQWADKVTQGLDEAIRTPLEADSPDPLCLCRIPAPERINELEFVFPLAANPGREALTPAVLGDLLRRHARGQFPEDYPDQVARLGFEPLAGFLKGFIDLVFTYQGRWYLADYKSNALGATSEAFRPARLLEAMTEHHYHLQYHLYAVALHRYLQWQLPEYDYRTHFGGVYYLFLRGMAPERGPATGVLFARPEPELIEELSLALAGATGGRS